MINLPDLSLTVFEIPKNGGTTLWGWAYWLRTGRLPGDNVYDHSWVGEGELQPRGMIVRRDPVERFISGYRNFRDKRGLNLSFTEFVEQFEELYRLDGDIRHHFLPQSSYYPSLDLKEVEWVIDFERFHECKTILEDLSRKALPEIHYQKSQFDDFHVEEWQAELVANSYQCDYEAGFGIWDAWRLRMET